MEGRLCILQMRASPGACGVTDHSLAMAGGLRQSGVATRLATSGPTVGEFLHLDLTQPPTMGANENLLVQLSPYGFDPRGVPAELERWLRSLRGSSWRGKLVVFFHETWAQTRRPWKSAFWYSPLQRLWCRRIAALADVGVFNSVVMLRWGEAHIRADACLLAPVYSNVGEPAAYPDWTSRSAAVAVFGSSTTRARIYRLMQGRLRPLLDQWGFSEIIDIGAPLPADVPDSLKGLPVCYRGALPAADVSESLSGLRAGLFEVPWGLASKSGVYAAYQAHGVVPISIHAAADSRYQGAPGPVLGKQFCTAGQALQGDALRAMSAEVYMHYQHHSIGRFSQRLAGVLCGGPAGV